MSQHTDQYVVVDLRAAWARKPFVSFWRADFSGYAYPLSWAGDYSRATVIEKGSYLTRRRYSAATGKYTGKWERFAVLRSVAEAIAIAPPPGQIDGNAGPVVINNKQNRDNLIANRLRLRTRKAWRAQIMDPDYGLGEIIYAPTASKARYQKFLSVDCDAVIFASIRVTRSPDDDIILPAVDAITAALDEEAKSVLNQTLINKRFYTATDDKAICSLVQAGLLENTGRGWNTGESYFVRRMRDIQRLCL